mgnify:FL=1
MLALLIVVDCSSGCGVDLSRDKNQSSSDRDYRSRKEKRSREDNISDRRERKDKKSHREKDSHERRKHHKHSKERKVFYHIVALCLRPSFDRVFSLCLFCFCRTRKTASTHTTLIIGNQRNITRKSAVITTPLPPRTVTVDMTATAVILIAVTTVHSGAASQGSA